MFVQCVDIVAQCVDIEVFSCVQCVDTVVQCVDIEVLCVYSVLTLQFNVLTLK